jgi:hypothetical protein
MVSPTLSIEQKEADMGNCLAIMGITTKKGK